MKADQLGMGAGVIEERLRVARVFGGDRRYALQRVGSTRREIAEVPEWRRDNVEGAGHVTTSPRHPPGELAVKSRGLQYVAVLARGVLQHLGRRSRHHH